MLKFESDNGFRKIALWNNEVPFDYISNKKLEMIKEPGKTVWNEGTICIETKLNPRHASNYAMICMKYTYIQSETTDIIIHYENGLVSAVTDDNEITAQFTYDAAGRLITYTNVPGESITFTYGDNGKIVSGTDPFGLLPLSWKDIAHGILNAVGIIPVVGDIESSQRSRISVNKKLGLK